MKYKAEAILENKDTILLDFDAFSTDYYLTKVQEMPSRKYLPKLKKWRCPLNIITVEYLSKAGFHIDPAIKKALKRPKFAKIDPGLLLPLRGYQQGGIGFIDYHNGRVLIGDETGIGKTVQALGWMHYRQLYPTLVVCPASLKLNWEREILKFVGKKSVVLSGSPKKNQRLEGDILIINYDIIAKWTTVLIKKNFKLLIADEAHLLKNADRKRSKAGLKLGTKIPHVLPMTATAVENSPMDLWNIFRLIDKDLFPSKHNFGVRYCGGFHNGWGWQYKGATHIDELKKILSSYMIRRKKSDVLKELPPKQRIVVPLEINNKKKYIEAERNFARWYNQRENKINVLAKLETLRQIVNQGKLNQIIEWIENYLEGGEKLIVFGIHIDLVESIAKAFKGQSVLLYGKMTPKQKQESIDKFQNNKKITLMSANIKTGGVGLNLTAASATCFVELPWNPATLEQAESRIDRIGQLADKIFNYYLIAPNTLEWDFMDLLDSKQKVMDKILNDKKTDSSNLLVELVKKVKARGRVT